MSKNEIKKGIKDDINFMENANWVLDGRTKLKEYVNKKENGTYRMACVFGLPTHFDKSVLYCLLHLMLKQSKLDGLEITTTRYAIVTELYGKKRTKPKIYQRVMEALRKWVSVYIHFEGTFFEGNRHTDRSFSIIDDVILYYDTKELYIKFNQQYIKQLRETKFFKFIDFDAYKTFQRAVSARLYEILCKSLEFNPTWTIGLQNLAEKMTLQKRDGAKTYYASDVLAKIKPGVNEISKKSSFKVEFVYNKQNDSITFKKIKAVKQIAKVIPAKKTQINPKPRVEDPVSKHDDKLIAECMQYFGSIAQKERAAIEKDIANSFFIYIPDYQTRIFSYLTEKKLWQPSSKKSLMK